MDIDIYIWTKKAHTNGAIFGGFVLSCIFKNKLIWVLRKPPHIYIAMNMIEKVNLTKAYYLQHLIAEHYQECMDEWYKNCKFKKDKEVEKKKKVYQLS